MPGTLLETRLHPPPPRRALTARPRLIAALDRATESRLALVSAPPGFGKSTLLAEWFRAPGHGWTGAWLSLEPADADPAVFWQSVLTCLEAAAPEPAAAARELLAAAGPEAAIARLLDALARRSPDLVVVLDDYHLVDGPPVQAGMTFLVDHLPPNVHIVVATRADPRLPLARLRARGELVEVRAADLRFTLEEATAYLAGTTDVALDADAVAALERRTEGWIAALQLAALSLRGRDDAVRFVERFAGDDRFVLDYLTDEVLGRQDGQVRAFLLETSLLDRLTADLCDAVTGRHGSRALLERLERENLFLVALDDQREWYRYHRLFADALAVHLRAERPALMPLLHRRASEWHARRGMPAEAIRHAIAAGDHEHAADLVEAALPEMRRTRQEATLRRWVESLPDSLVRARPVLGVGYVGALMAGGQLDGVEGRLRDAEHGLAAAARAAPPGEPQPADPELGRLPSAIAMYRAALARAAGDDAASIDAARGALELASADDELARGAASGFLGLAYWSRGDLAAGEQAWTDAARSLERAGHVSDVLGCSIAIADIQAARGRLAAATRTMRRGLALAARQPGPVRGAADMHVGIAELLLERNDLAAGRLELESADEAGEALGLPQNAYRARVVHARFALADGDPERALDLLDEAERRYDADFFPNVRPIPAIRARVWIGQGRVAEALAWARDAGISGDEEPTLLREYELITLARALLAGSRTAGAGDHPDAGSREVDRLLQLLDRLLAAADAGGRGRSRLEILILRALAHQAAGDRGAARHDLERAVALAEPEGAQRVFVGEGARLARLLEAVARPTQPGSFARRLAAAASARPPVAGRQPLVEPLSERELDVLRLLVGDLSGPDIARQLFVSLNTLRTHTRSVYAKLGVSSRRAAVSRAAELGLLAQRTH